MKAPDAKFVRYSDKDWAAIKRVFATVGIDADHVEIGERSHGEGDYFIVTPNTDDPFERFAFSVQSLRELLNHLAWECDKQRRWSRPLTPKQDAKKLKKFIEAYQGVKGLVWYDPDAAPDDDSTPDVIKTAQEQLDRLVALGRTNKNARKDWRAEFWIRLRAVWRVANSPSRKLRINFLVTCSAPLFPVDDKAVANFLDNPKTKARKPSPF